MRDIPANIFKVYDIRGIVGGTLTPEIAKLIGRAVGSQARAIGQSSVGAPAKPHQPAHAAGYNRKPVPLNPAGIEIIRPESERNHRSGSSMTADFSAPAWTR